MKIKNEYRYRYEQIMDNEYRYRYGYGYRHLYGYGYRILLYTVDLFRHQLDFFSSSFFFLSSSAFFFTSASSSASLTAFSFLNSFQNLSISPGYSVSANLGFHAGDFFSDNASHSRIIGSRSATPAK